MIAMLPKKIKKILTVKKSYRLPFGKLIGIPSESRSGHEYAPRSTLIQDSPI